MTWQERRRQEIRDTCAARGIRIAARGLAFQLRGAGVDMLASDLALVSLADLLPVHPPRRDRARQA